MLIAEELFLLLVDDEGKDESWGTYRGYGINGAVLADLVVAGRLALDDAKDPRMTVLAGPPPGHPALEHALEAVTARDGKKMSSMISGGRLKAEPLVVRSLVDAGIIRVEEKRMLGLVPERYPVVDPRPERAVRDRLASVLRGSTTPTDADVAILGILQGLEVAATVLGPDAGGLGKRDLKARISELAAQSPSGTAVSRSVQAMTAALVTAAIVPVIASGG